jgi:uncharacterized repeat protein (TIGR03847 family)
VTIDDAYEIDLDPVSFITVGALGPPGERTFFLQAAAGPRTVSLLIEKEHAAALSISLRRLLSAAEADPGESARSSKTAMDLLQPVDVEFRVGQLGIGIDDDRDMVVLVAEELVEEDEPEGQRARFVASFAQMEALAKHAMKVVHAGRPVCELCGEPMDPDGHFCARRNGHPPPPD